MSQPIRGQGGHLVFSIGPKNTNFGSGALIKEESKSENSWLGDKFYWSMTLGELLHNKILQVIIYFLIKIGEM